MMPDTSAGDSSALWTGISAVVITVLTWLGARRGEKDKKTVPAPTPEMAGVSFGLVEQSIQREIMADTKRTADACDALTRMFAEWIEDEKDRRQVEKEHTTDNRIGKVEDLIQDLLRQIDASERNHQRRHNESRGQR